MSGPVTDAVKRHWEKLGKPSKFMVSPKTFLALEREEAEYGSYGFAGQYDPLILAESISPAVTCIVDFSTTRDAWLEEELNSV